MSEKGSYELPASQQDARSEIERLAAQASSGWSIESRKLTGFGLEDGMSVLELGSGPGFITKQIADLVPNSPITCVEIDRTLLDQAEQYLHDKTDKPVTFIEGSVMDTGLPSNQFDFAYARFVFQHLPDPAGAAKEILRVLKPSGKLVVCDIDDGLFGLFEPPIPEFAPVIEAFGKLQASKGGNRHIGRQLSNILNSAGFSSSQLEVIGSHSAERGIDSYLQHINPDRMAMLVKNRFLSAEDLERFGTALEAWATKPEAYTLWLTLMVCAEKTAVNLRGEDEQAS